MKQTCLYDVHVALGARMAGFGGFKMPIQYAGIVAEHHACRRGAVLFDTCHMGEFLVEGAGAVADLEGLVSCAVASLAEGQCRYGMLCNEQGGVIDDLLVYRLAAERFMLVVNAATQAGDAAWILSHLGPATRFTNRSDDTDHAFETGLPAFRSDAAKACEDDGMFGQHFNFFLTTFNCRYTNFSQIFAVNWICFLITITKKINSSLFCHIIKFRHVRKEDIWINYLII